MTRVSRKSSVSTATLACTTLRVVAALHSVDVDAAGLGALGKAANYSKRTLKTWTKQCATGPLEAAASGS